MAAPNAGINIAATSAAAEDAHRGSIASYHGLDPERPPSFNSKEEEEHDRPTAPDQHDPRFVADKKEIWSYYSYYVGNNGLSLFNYAVSAASDVACVE